MIVLRWLLGMIIWMYVGSYAFATYPAPEVLSHTIPSAGLQAEGNGEWQKAISIYLDSLIKNPLQVTLWVRVANLEIRLKNYTLAIAAYEHAITTEPNNPVLHKALSEIYAETNQPEKALTEINQTVSLTPNNVDYLIARAKIANWNKTLLFALDSYQRLFSLSEHEKITIPPIELLMEIGSLQSQLHQTQNAIHTYQQAVFLDPKKATLYQKLSQLYASMNDPKQALDMINGALALDPNNTDYLKSKKIFINWISNNEKQLAKEMNPIHVVSVSPFDQYINLANQQASLHRYNEAARTMRKAIRLKPHDVTLYQKLATIYAMANQSQFALNAINEALKLSPNRIDYLRQRGQLAAWADNKKQAQESYEQILQLKPRDQNAMLQVAHIYAWQGKTDMAIHAYKELLCIYPRNATGWIQYAEVLLWTANYIDAFNAIKHYKQLAGDQTEYRKLRARTLALTGRFKSAETINAPLLQSMPNDPYILSTQVIISTKSFNNQKAVTILKKIPNKNNKDPQINGLKNITLTPLKSNINLEADYAGASDTTRILDIPVFTQYFLNPSTSLLFQGLYERASASVSSGLETIDGQSAISDESVKIGVTKQINNLNLKGLVGALKIQNKNNHGIYDALINTNFGESGQITFENSQDLFRPYLVPQTPKLISLQIMENRRSAFLQWQPDVQKFLDVVTSYSDLSDNNNYYHVNIWPKARVYGSQHWQVTVGVDGDFWKFQRRASDGYYSPLHFDGYEGTVQLYYSPSENVGCSLSGGFGMQKDETFPHYFYEEDLGMQLFLGIYNDLELQIKSGFTLRDNPSNNNYKFWSTGATLTKRF